MRFVLAGGIAAAANFASRFVFSLWLPFEAAVLLAYLVGMAAAFALMRRYAFAPGRRSLRAQIAAFCAVNLAAVVQTVAISSLLLRVVLPALGVQWHTAALAHAAGVAVPALTSYLGHKLWTFR